MSGQILSRFSVKEATSVCHGQPQDWTFVPKLKSDKVKSLHFSQPHGGTTAHARQHGFSFAVSRDVRDVAMELSGDYDHMIMTASLR